jgi:hypothetical protein
MAAPRTHEDAGAVGHDDAAAVDLPDASDAPPDASTPDERSRVERPPGALDRPPTKLPDDLRPPK